MRIGTCHFVDRRAANKYYREQESVGMGLVKLTAKAARDLVGLLDFKKALDKHAKRRGIVNRQQ